MSTHEERVEDNVEKAFWKSPLGIALQVIITSVTIATTIQAVIPLRSDAYTSSMAAQRKIELDKEFDEVLQRCREVAKGAAESGKDQILLYLAQNFYTKDEVPPDKVKLPLIRLQKFVEQCDARYVKHEDVILRLKERLLLCCRPPNLEAVP